MKGTVGNLPVGKQRQQVGSWGRYTCTMEATPMPSIRLKARADLAVSTVRMQVATALAG